MLNFTHDVFDTDFASSIAFSYLYLELLRQERNPSLGQGFQKAEQVRAG